MLRGRWCDIIVLNAHAPSEDKIDYMNYSFCKELGHLCDKFPKYHTKILLDISAKGGKEDIFKPAVENRSFYKINNDNGVRVVNFATSKILIFRSIMFPHHNIHKFIWTIPAGKNQQ
jgi:hypothetical protein